MDLGSSYNKTATLYLNGISNLNNTIICYQPSSITTNGVWQGENHLTYSLPLFIVQLMIIVVTTQVLFIILGPFHLPRIVPEIIAGALLGPSGFGAIEWIGKNIFPLRSMMVLETMANIGLLYYMFLVGVEMDVSLVKRCSRQTLAVAIFGCSLSLIVYLGMMILLNMMLFDGAADLSMKLFYQGVIVSFSAFPVISRMLVELKLINTELGRNVMSAALITDLFTWVIVTICMAWAESMDSKKESYVAILGSVGFALICIIVIRPIIMWTIDRTPEGENFNEFYICLILTGVMICGFVTDAMGTHFVVGSFLFGLTIPNGPLGTALLEKLEDFVTTLLLPLFFTLSGIRTNIYSFQETKERTYIFIYIITIFFASVTKVFATFIIGLYFDMQLHEALSLGMLMNTKGITEIIVVNVGFGGEVISSNQLTSLVICIVVMNVIAVPTIASLYNTRRRFIRCKMITIQKAKMDEKLKILTCVHTPQNVPTVINLLKSSHATERSPFDIYALHLVELTRRASSMLTIHDKNGVKSNKATNHAQAQLEHIVTAFESYADNTPNVSVQSLTAISPYPTMHEDICNLAEDKRITLIVLPFHKRQTVDGSMESINPALRQVNQNVLANAPCSVGILIDREFVEFSSRIIHHIAVIFIGGPDDREALAYGWRMAENPGINLTVLRFVVGDDIVELDSKQCYKDEILKVTIDTEKELQLDNEYIGDFRVKLVDRETIAYKEKMVNNVEETINAIREMDSIHDFYVVGRRQEFPLLADLNEFSENPELGVIGDLLASSDFVKNVSVLVMQQYVGEDLHGGDNKVSPAESNNQMGVVSRVVN